MDDALPEEGELLLERVEALHVTLTVTSHYFIVGEETRRGLKQYDEKKERKLRG